MYLFSRWGKLHEGINGGTKKTHTHICTLLSTEETISAEKWPHFTSKKYKMKRHMWHEMGCQGMSGRGGHQRTTPARGGRCLVQTVHKKEDEYWMVWASAVQQMSTPQIQTTFHSLRKWKYFVRAKAGMGDRVAVGSLTVCLLVVSLVGLADSWGEF